MKPRAAITESPGCRAVAALIGLSLPVIWFLTLVVPVENALRIRNGLIAEIGTVEQFKWSPGEVPPTYLLDGGQPTAEFSDRQLKLGGSRLPSGGAEFERMLAVASHLMNAPRRVGGPIQADPASTYEAIVSDGKGYCADFTQVFNAIAITSDVPVREWSIAFSAFGSGHAFNEIYDATRQKWILIDSFHSLYFVDAVTREPLSVLEVHDRLLRLTSDADPEIVRIEPDEFPFRSDPLALDYYRRGMPQLALLWGNNVFDYGRAAPIRAASLLGRSAEQLVAIALGRYPKMLIYPVGVSDRDVDELFRLRNQFLLATASMLIAVVLFGGQLLGMWRRKITAVRTSGDV